MFFVKSQISPKFWRNIIWDAIPCILRYYKPMLGKKCFPENYPNFAVSQQSKILQNILVLCFLARISLHAGRFLGHWKNGDLAILETTKTYKCIRYWICDWKYLNYVISYKIFTQQAHTCNAIPYIYRISSSNLKIHNVAASQQAFI